MNPVLLDNDLSLEARGAWAYAMAAGLETITAQTIQSTGCGRERAYRILSELAAAGHITRVKSGYRVTAFPTLSELSPGEENQELRLFRKPENPSLSTTYMYESSDLMNVVESYGFSENPSLSEGESEQLTLDGCPEPPPPLAAPPAPAEEAKPKRPRNPPPPAEVKALYGPMFDLTKRPRSGKSAMGVYTKCAALWREFQATPEQVAAFWDWFKVFSAAAQVAAQYQRPLNPPLPRQVHEDWPRFLEWWEVRQADLARRVETERRRREAPPEEAPARRGLGYNPFRNKLTQPAPVLAAASD